MTRPCAVCANPVEQPERQRFPRIPARKYCSLACRQEATRRQLRESYARLRDRRITGTLAYQAAHREEILAQRREPRAREPEKHRAWTRASVLKFKYGLTPTDFIAMERAQDGLCAICREPERRRNADGTPQPLSVDHDHETGQVRGLLCARCNSVLGWIESPGRLDAALAYLRSAEGRDRKVAGR